MVNLILTKFPEGVNQQRKSFPWQQIRILRFLHLQPLMDTIMRLGTSIPMVMLQPTSSVIRE